MNKINLPLPADLLETIDELRGDIPRTAWIRRAIEQQLAAASSNPTEGDPMRPPTQGARGVSSDDITNRFRYIELELVLRDAEDAAAAFDEALRIAKRSGVWDESCEPLTVRALQERLRRNLDTARARFNES